MTPLESVTAVINQLLPEPHAGFLSGIVFGTKTTLAPWLKDALVTSGTIHIAALSGMNITILIDFVGTTLLWLVSKRAASVLALGFIIGFVWLVGPTPTIVRAAIMGSISLGAIVFGRQYWALFALGVTVVVMLVINPSWTFELSFQLSVAATLGIILFAKKIVDGRSLIVDKYEQEKRNASIVLSTIYKLQTTIYSELRLTLSAQVFTIPLILFAFRRISLIAPVTNVLIAPVIPPLTIMGLLTSFAGWVWLPLGYPFAWASWVLLNYVMAVVWVMSRIPFASIGW